MLPAISMGLTVITFNSSNNARRAREIHFAIKVVYVLGVVTAILSAVKRGALTAETMDAIFLAVSVNTSPYIDGFSCKIITFVSVSLFMSVLVKLLF